MNEAKVIGYNIVDTQTGRVVGTAKSRASASRMCCKRDLEYGAVRFRPKAIWSDAK